MQDPNVVACPLNVVPTSVMVNENINVTPSTASTTTITTSSSSSSVPMTPNQEIHRSNSISIWMENTDDSSSDVSCTSTDDDENVSTDDSDIGNSEYNRNDEHCELQHIKHKYKTLLKDHTRKISKYRVKIENMKHEITVCLAIETTI